MCSKWDESKENSIKYKEWFLLSSCSTIIFFPSVDVIVGFLKSFPLKSPDAMISSTTNKWGRAGEVLGK